MKSTINKAIAALLMIPCVVLFGQAPPPPPDAPPSAQTAPGQPLTPEQLDNLVAPIALYPDPLLGQVLAASTYPLEVVEAQQWLQQNPSLRGQDLINAAKQQNWDPSVQALVAFPDVVNLLTRDVQWTTDLGNAFLAQQGDLMASVQRMRGRAQQNGRLASTPQQTVTTQTQEGQSAITIQPADPNVVYVPVYNPVYVWGPPVWGYYPPLWYPGVGFGFGFGPGIYLDAFFPGWGLVGWPGWGFGWGWGCGWFGSGLYVNAFFFNHYGFHGYWGGGRFAGDRMGWAHDPYHRAGVPYRSGAVASRFDNSRFAAGRGAFNSRSFSGTRGFSTGPGNYNRGMSSQGFAPGGRGNFSQGLNHGSVRGNNGAQTFGGTPRTGPAPNLGGSFRGNMGPTPRTSFGPSYSGPGSFGRMGGAPGSVGGRSFSAAPSFSGRSFSGGGYRGGGGRSFSGGSFGGGRSFSGGGGGARGGGRR